MIDETSRLHSNSPVIRGLERYRLIEEVSEILLQRVSSLFLVTVAGVLGLGLLQDGDVMIGVFAKGFSIRVSYGFDSCSRTTSESSWPRTTASLFPSGDRLNDQTCSDLKAVIG